MCGGTIPGNGVHDCEAHRRRKKARRVRKFTRPEEVRQLESDELALEDGKDGSGLPWRYERCKSSRCLGRRVTVGFQVSDEAWEAVTGGSERVLCLSCFDEMAQRKGIEYEVLGLHPVTWSDP